MNVQAEINWIISEVSKVKDPELIKAFKNMLKYREKHISKDWWNEISEEEKTEIEQGLKDAEQGKLVPHETVMAKYKQWL
jgi:formylmethanofuran dehydrogenase subunit B